MKILETKRTQLRAFKKSDLTHLYTLMTDSEIMKFTGFLVPQPRNAIESHLLNWIQCSTAPFGVWCVVNKKTDEFIGWYMLKKTIQNLPEIGFMFLKRHWNKGYATEVSSEVIHYALNELRCPQVIASTNAKNLASIKVLQKVGLTLCAELKPNSENRNILYFKLVK